jgi:hypothetical protein
LGEAAGGAGEDLIVADAKRLDPALLAEREADEEAELNELGIGEVLVQLRPQRIVSEVGVPDDGAGVGQRGFLALAEVIGLLEVQQLGVFLLRDASRSGPDRPLDPSVLALDALRDVDAAELLELGVEHTFAEGGLPGLGEGADDGGDVGADSLALRPGRAMQAGVLQIAEDLGIGDLRKVGVGNTRHARLLCPACPYRRSARKPPASIGG